MNNNQEKYIVYEKDVVQSRLLHDEFKKCIRLKECYDNVMRIMFLDNFHENEHAYQIAFGYMSCESVENLYFRHAFFVSEDGKVIDPTLPEKEKKYYIFAMMSFSDYFGRVAEEQSSDLTRNLMQSDQAIKEWLQTNKNIVCLG